MASPSVVLYTTNPTTNAVPSASSPTAYAEPIASPSPRLCSPMPMAIMNVSDLRIDAALQQRGREPGGLLPVVGSLSHALRGLELNAVIRAGGLRGRRKAGGADMSSEPRAAGSPGSDTAATGGRVGGDH
jgi:hypothetical protein